MSRPVPAFLVAGTNSGAGKTTVVAGIVGALARRGLVVQPFKVGPDYIDPSYHSRLAGRPCRNLDSWMVPAERMRELYERAVQGADVAVVEGVMGLFDGHPDRAASSSAEVAKLLGLPVVLVMNVESLGQSAGAMAYGYSRLDPALDVAGVVANRVGGSGHAKLVADAIAAATGLPTLGYLPRRDDLGLPERHLGLVPMAEGRIGAEFFSRMVDQVAETVNLDALLKVAGKARNRGSDLSPVPTPKSRQRWPATSGGPGAPVAQREMGRKEGATALPLFPSVPRETRTTIAVARDEAFCFYYEDNLDLLRAWGARLVEFSPLRDEGIPGDVQGLYLGGGFPELYAAELAANRAMHVTLREWHTRGMPIYAECGGLIYLCRTLGDQHGVQHESVGLVPADAYLAGGRLALGYAEVTARFDTPLLAAGDTARGHEFHYSWLDRSLDGPEAAYTVAGREGGHGFREGNLLASYVHLHFASNPVLAPNFVRACARWGGRG